MGKGTSRKSVSVKGITYQRMEDYLASLPPPPPGEKALSKSGLLEQIIEEKLGPPTEEDLQKFGALQKAEVEAEETESQPSPEPKAPVSAEPVETVSEPPPDAMPRGPLPEFTQRTRSKTPSPEPEVQEAAQEERTEIPKSRPDFMQPVVKEPIVQEKKDDDPDDIPPAIRFF